MATNTSTSQPEIHPLANVEIQHLDHLGLVAIAIDSLKLIERIDKRLPLPQNSDANLTHGQRVKAMIINGLGYTSSPLYLTPKFFRHKDISRLIGSGIEAEYLNEYALGRTLDALFNYGTTQLFAEIAFEIAQERGLLGKSVHIDTTTLLLHGEYVAAAELANQVKEIPAELTAKMKNIPTPALGHSKAHRHDLKQLVMSLTVTGAAAMPLWFEGLSGNSSDKTNFHDSIAKFESFRSNIALADEFLWVADSALYSKGKLQDSHIKWLTRIPQTKKNAKMLVSLPDKDISWDDLGNGYKGAIYDSLEPEEKWALLFSEQAYRRELNTFNKRIDKAFEKAQKDLRKLCKTPFSCEKDALKEAKKWAKSLKYHEVAFSVVRVERYSKAGKPAKGTTPDIIEYILSGKITNDEKSQAEQQHRLGRFILGTNVMDDATLTAQKMLSTYIEQQDVERGFRFIKSDEFHLDGIYLKLPSRIDALMMIMTLSLMVYNVTEYEMRETMAEHKETLPNQKNKQTSRPTLRWVFQMMQNIDTLKMGGMTGYVSGRDAEKEKIIKLFGEKACAMYGIGE